MFIKPGKSTAIAYKEQQINYDQLLQQITSFSDFFKNKKVDKAAIFSANRPEWAYAFYAAWMSEAIAVPVDHMATAEEVAFILNDCRAGIIFITNDTLPVFEKAGKLLEYEIEIINLDKINVPESQAVPAGVDIQDMNKTAVIIYTSGTTGSPKGVMLSFKNLQANINAVANEYKIYNKDRNVMALLPLHHIFPLMGTLIAPLFVGAKIAFAPSLQPEDIIDTLQTNEIAIIIGVPRLYAAIYTGIMNKINAKSVIRLIYKLASKIDSRSFSVKIFKTVHQRFGGKVEFMVSGGAKLDEDVARGFKTLGFEMLEGFGMTEAAPMITFTRPGHWKIGSAGQPMTGVEVQIKDGEIIARGDNIMQGYYKRPEETAAVLKDGWLHTGDLGYLDKNSFLHITGRKKEIIVLSNGKNINPEEIEKKLAAMSPYVAEVGVYQQNDKLQAAIFPDFRKLQEKGVVNMEETFRWDLIDQYNKGASPYKRISKFHLLKEELPKTRLGKIQRFRLPELNGVQVARQVQQVPDPQFEEYEILKDFLAEMKNAKVFPPDHLEIDLGLDSLDKVSLSTFIQSTFGINTGDDLFIEQSTVQKLAEFIRDNKKKIEIETVKWTEILKEKIELNLHKSWFTQNILKNISKLALKSYFRLKSEGEENIPDGPVIIAPNHQSFIDGLFVSVFIKNRVFKNTYFYAKEKHLRNRLVRAFAHRHNVIVVDINRDLKSSLQKLAALLEKGKNIIIFPEGTRTHTGKLGTFKKAFAILSREMNVPVVPVSIKGAFEALPRGSRIPRPWKKINVKFHKPVYPSDHDYDSLLETVSGQLAAELG